MNGSPITLIFILFCSSTTPGVAQESPSQEFLETSLYGSHFSLESFLDDETRRIQTFIENLGPDHYENKVEGVVINGPELIVSGSHHPELIPTRHALGVFISMLVGENGHVSPANDRKFRALLLNRGMNPEEIKRFFNSCAAYDEQTFSSKAMEEKWHPLMKKDEKQSDEAIAKQLEDYQKARITVGNEWVWKIMGDLSTSAHRVVISFLHEKYVPGMSSNRLISYTSADQIDGFRTIPTRTGLRP